MLWEKYCRGQKDKHPLLCVFWETTLRCNLKCAHCGSSCGPEVPKKEELSTGEIKNVFKSIAEDYDPKRIMIAVTGGEPLLRRDVFDVMGYASGLGFSWGLVTNGTLIDERIVHEMKKAGMLTVSVSIDGTEDIHDEIRGKTGAFQEATQGTGMLTDSKHFKQIEIITCVSKKNIDKLDEIYELCKDLGVDGWRIFTVVRRGRAKEDDDFSLTPKEQVFVLDYIKEKRKEKELKVNFCDEGFLGLDYEGEVRDQFFYCWAGITVGSILYNGDVAACPIIPREHTKQGNIRERRFSEIWENEYQMFREREWKKNSYCGDCSLWDFCEGESMHLWDFDKGEPMCCNYNLINKNKENS